MFSKFLLVIGVIVFAVCSIPAGLMIDDPYLKFLSAFASAALFSIFAVLAIVVRESGLDEIYQKRYEELKRKKRIERMAKKMRKEKNKGK